MTYAETEKMVFDRLWAKHQQDPSFTFSVRKRATKAAEADYFIGTRTSGYFAFTCWHIPMFYPGASVDFCNFMIYPAEDNASFYFQVNTPNTLEKSRESPALQACHTLANEIIRELTNAGVQFVQNDASNALLWIGVQPNIPEKPKLYLDPKTFLDDLISLVDQLLPIIDRAIETIRLQYPTFPGKRIDPAQFQAMITRMHIRQEKYRATSDASSGEATDNDLPTMPASMTLPADLSRLPSKNLLLYGPPGTGKTYYLQTHLLEYFRAAKPDESPRYTFVTFHQAFSYEDFIEGIKPETSDTTKGQVIYKVKPGLFYTACNEAARLAGFDSLSHALAAAPEQRAERFASVPPYALFIDEINRANVSATFGELITLLEADKRLGTDGEMSVTLPYSKKPFGVPANLYVIGTMNTADRSVEALDTALRRRFVFREMVPNPSLLKQVIAGVPLGQLLTTINHRLERLLSRDLRIGHAYMISVQTEAELVDAFNYQIIPLLQEYFFSDYAKIGLVLGASFVDREMDNIAFAPFDDDVAGQFEEAPVWTLRPATIEAIRTILQPA